MTSPEDGIEYPRRRRLVILRPTHLGGDEYRMYDEQWLQNAAATIDDSGKLSSEKVLESSTWTGGVYRRTRCVTFQDLKGDPKEEFRGKENLVFLHPGTYVWDFFEQVEGEAYVGEIPCTGTGDYLERK